MHWWQGAFSSSSSSSSKPQQSHDDSDIPYSSKPSFFSSRRSRHNARKTMWRSPSHSEHSRSPSSPAPQPLPMPELQVLMRRDHKFMNSSSSSSNVPLPSPRDAAPRERGGAEERERDASGGGIDGYNGLESKVARQDTRMNAERPETRSSRVSPQKQNSKTRYSGSYHINIPTSAPTSPYISPALSPPGCDVLLHQTMFNGIFQVWSAPEMPHSDENSGLGFDYQWPSERTVLSSDNSPLQSPRGSIHLPATSSPRPASPMSARLSSDNPLGRRDSNAQVAVHPLPLPPGAAVASQTTSVSTISDFSGPSASAESSPSPAYAGRPEYSGAHTPSQSVPISPCATKAELKPVKSQWQKGKLIGRGTFGSVYVASNRQTGALCAMKEVEILPDDSKSAESIRQLEQEIKVLSRLKHPNIVQYYGSEIVGDKFYIYLEYVHPGSINRFIQDHCGAITESVVRSFTRHILCGLAYLHSKKTIHRDIKGANLLVDAYGVVKLADFGMAKHLNGQAADLSLKGSPYWLAPELLQSVTPKDTTSDVALAVDIWSLGCTIIEMMNGKPPWSEYEGAAAMFKVLQESPPIPETLSADGKNFLQCCFCRNPADRPTASKLLDHPFVNYSQQPDATKSHRERSSENHQFLREGKSHQRTLSFEGQIKNGKLANNEMIQRRYHQTLRLAVSPIRSPRSTLETLPILSPASSLEALPILSPASLGYNPNSPGTPANCQLRC